MRFGIIDLGTNTFHCLIAETTTDGHWESVHRERRFVKLAENGIERIREEAYNRGMEALLRFAEVLQEYEVTAVTAIGTAALRTAENGAEFIREARERARINIQLINGDQEADYIYQGVAQAVALGPERALIMDIGGGSVEFIIANQVGISWRQSFPIGVAVLYNHFHKTEPITESEIRQLSVFLEQHLQPLAQALQEYPTTHLIGAAGTFDVIGNVLGIESAAQHSTAVDLAGFQALYFEMLATDAAGRLDHPGIPETRADMIVVALVLVKYVLDLARIEQLTVSRFSMKEGILVELMNG